MNFFELTKTFVQFQIDGDIGAVFGLGFPPPHGGMYNKVKEK